MSSQSHHDLPPREHQVPSNANLLLNSPQFPEENRGLATNMGPQAAVFVAKLSPPDETPEFPLDRLTSLLERVHAGGMGEYLGVSISQAEPGETGKVGRPAALNEGLKNRICALLALGYSRSLAAAELGIARSIITRTMQRDKAFGKAVLRAEELYERNPLLTIMDAARRNWRAAAWLLQNHKPHQSVIRRKRRQASRESAAKAKEFFNRDLRKNDRPFNS